MDVATEQEEGTEPLGAVDTQPALGARLLCVLGARIGRLNAEVDDDVEAIRARPGPMVEAAGVAFVT